MLSARILGWIIVGLAITPGNTDTDTVHDRKYLSDPTEDVRIATENLLGEFLREIVDITDEQKKNADDAKRSSDAELHPRRADGERERLPDITMASSERATFLPENDDAVSDDDSATPNDEREGEEERDRGGTSNIACPNIY